MINRKKVLVTASVIVGVLLVAAVVFGILNALVAQGKWSFGWRDYRYDESDFEIGEGSIPTQNLTRIELDWIDGEVEIVPCQDRYLSLTELAAEELPESAQLRWRVSEDGKTLTVKYRKSSWFFGVGSGNREKKLTVRVPERFFESLDTFDVAVVSTNVTVNDIKSKNFSFSSDTGALTTENCMFDNLSVHTKNGAVLVNANVVGRVELSSKHAPLTLSSAVCPQEITAESRSGNVTLSLPTDASFTLEWGGGKGTVTSGFACRQEGTVYTVGTGEKRFYVNSKSGNLLISVIELQ